MAYVKEEALQKREPLVQGAELNIDGKGGKFLIRELIGAGGTSLVYDAVLVRADGSRVTGVLKEFYPQVTAGTSYNFSMLLRYMTVRRKPNGTLAIPAELRDGQRKRLEEVDSLLHEIKSEGLGLRHFIPNMEVFTCGKVPYIFTAESYSGETLAQFCKEQAWANPTSTSLRQILNTVYALACADAQLCAAGAILLDIKPENILMVYRSTPNGLRKDAFLDTVSLFDVESIVLKSQIGSDDLMLPFSAGFTAPELGGYMSSARRDIGKAADVYAMAATLFYCLTRKLAWLDTVQGYAEALQEGPFGAVLTNEQRAEIGKLLAAALVYEPDHRMQEPEMFANALEKIVRETQASAAEQLTDRRRKMQEHLSDALASLLYKWPLFAYGNAEDKDIRVLIAAEKNDVLKQAINAVFSSCHVLGHQVHVLAAAPQAEKAVGEWMQDIDHAEDWFCCQDNPQPYDWKEKLGAVSWLNLQPDAENIRKAAEQFVPGSVLVLSGDDATASEIAKAIPAPEAAKRLCAYTCAEGGQSLYAEAEENRVFVRLTPDDVEDAYSASAENIAFNAHLLYERQKNPSCSLLEVKHNFENYYNKAASFDTALAVKCRLFSIDVPWTDDPEKDGRNFEEALKQNQAAVKELAWVEHRRWVASKILKWAKALPEKDFTYLKNGGANGSRTNFKKDGVLYHAYLVPSALDEVRPEGWQTAVEWRDSNQDAEIPQDLDALSHNGAVLARMFAATAKKNRDVVHRGLKSFEVALEELTLELNSAAINELETHKKSLLHCIQKLLSPEVRQADAAYYQIENVRMEHFLKEQLPASEVAVMQLEILNKNLFAILYSISPVEPKALDDVLIENIGFQLRAKPMVMAKLLGTEDLRVNLVPARVFEVSKLIYIAQADTDGAAEKYIRIAEDAAAALHHYGASVDVELRLIAGAQTEIPACRDVQVQIIPANEAPEETMRQALQGVEVIDLTNGQEDLCTLAGIYAECTMLVQRDGVFRALRGKVPAQIPLPQSWDVDGLFRLSGAVPHKEEDTQTKIDYEKVNTLYRQILENFGRAAFYDICRDFAEAYSKQSTTYFSQLAGPDAQMQTYTMPTERWEELEPLLRKLQKYKYIQNLTSMVKAGQAKIAFMAGQKCAASLDYALKNCIDRKSVLKDFGTERNSFVIHTEPAVVRMPLGRQAVVEFLQTQGCLQAAFVDGKLEISGMTPEIPALLQKYGNALEGGVFANLQENTRFSDEKISYEYSWGSGTLNELDVVAVLDKEKLVLISCKACRQLEIAFVDEIAIRAASLHVGAVPVLVCSELQPGDKQAFRDRCRSQGVVLVDAADMDKVAEKICCAAESEA
jgi:serine/threonine protein kinase